MNAGHVGCKSAGCLWPPPEPTSRLRGRPSGQRPADGPPSAPGSGLPSRLTGDGRPADSGDDDWEQGRHNLTTRCPVVIHQTLSKCFTDTFNRLTNTAVHPVLPLIANVLRVHPAIRADNPPRHLPRQSHTLPTLVNKAVGAEGRRSPRCPVPSPGHPRRPSSATTGHRPPPAGRKTGGDGLRRAPAADCRPAPTGAPTG